MHSAAGEICAIWCEVLGTSFHEQNAWMCVVVGGGLGPLPNPVLAVRGALVS